MSRRVRLTVLLPGYDHFIGIVVTIGKSSGAFRPPDDISASDKITAARNQNLYFRDRESKFIPDNDAIDFDTRWLGSLFCY